MNVKFSFLCLLASSRMANAQDQNFDLIGKAHAAICDTLKDCASARFQREVVRKTPNGTPVVCGEYNAKNSYGGYVGFEPYIFAGDSLLTPHTLGNIVPTLFSSAWKRSCE